MFFIILMMFLASARMGMIMGKSISILLITSYLPKNELFQQAW